MLNDVEENGFIFFRFIRIFIMSHLMLFLVAFSFCPNVFAIESENLKARELHYEIYFSMDYLGEFDKPKSAKIDLPDASNNSLVRDSRVSATTPRTFGLKQLKTVFSWEALSATKLNLVLRPDAINRKNGIESETNSDQQAVEFDTRAGDVYKPPATIRLLDAYQIATDQKELSLAVGVWEELGHSRASYTPLTQFGLTVMLPQKFSGARLGWNKYAFVPSSLEKDAAAKGAAWSLEVFVIQGDQDRAESLRRNDDTFDITPAARDPYFGGAAYIGWQHFNGIELGFLSGVDDAKTEGIRKQEVFGQGVAVAKTSIATLRTKMDFDARYAKETWQGGNVDVAPLAQQSASLTTSSLISDQLLTLVGIYMGQSERHRNYDATKVMEGQDMKSVKQIFGYQLEAGFKYMVSLGLDLQMLISREFREETDAAGKKQGAFGEEGDRKLVINRLGLELAYTVGK